MRKSRFHAPPAPSSTRKACKIYWCSLRLKHIKKFEAISKHRPLTGQGLEALFQNSPQKFNLFYVGFTHVSCIMSNGAADVLHISREQRHRRRTICFVKIVNGAGATSTFFLKREKVKPPGNYGAHAAIEKWMQMNMRFFVKTTADVRHLLRGSRISPQTCHKKKWISRGEFV